MATLVFQHVTKTLVFREAVKPAIIVQTPNVIVGPRGESGPPGPPGPPGSGTVPTALHGGHF